MQNEVSIKRITLAALAGGAILFVWAAAAWMVLPLHSSIKPLPDEKAVLSSMERANAPRGIYFVGGEEKSPGPQALVVYTPHTEAMTGRQLMRSFAFDLVAAFAVAWLLSRATAMSFAKRVVFVVVAGGLLAAVIVDLPNWNWFAYPADYTLASAANKLIGWVLAGLALAAIVRRPAAAGAAA
jgi:hypothetical protein